MAPVVLHTLLRNQVINHENGEGPGGSISWVVGLLNNSCKPITNTVWVRARLCKLQKRCTRLAAASAKVYQLLAHGRWFSPGTPASSTTKTGRHDIAKILLKVALSTINQSINHESEKDGIVTTTNNKRLVYQQIHIERSIKN